MSESICVASCLAEQTALSDLLLDCTMTMTCDAVFRVVFAYVYVFVFVMEILEYDLWQRLQLLQVYRDPGWGGAVYFTVVSGDCSVAVNCSSGIR